MASSEWLLRCSSYLLFATRHSLFASAAEGRRSIIRVGDALGPLGVEPAARELVFDLVVPIAREIRVRLVHQHEPRAVAVGHAVVNGVALHVIRRQGFGGERHDSVLLKKSWNGEHERRMAV